MPLMVDQYLNLFKINDYANLLIREEGWSLEIMNHMIWNQILVASLIIYVGVSVQCAGKHTYGEKGEGYSNL